MSGYLWYFHAAEEIGFGIGAIFFDPPNYRVKRMPVTPAMLTEFANKGKWDIVYPDHTLPKYRYDLLINTVFIWVLGVAFAIGLVLKAIKHFNLKVSWE